MKTHPLAGIYAAAITPLKPDYSPCIDDMPDLLDFYTRRGCHGALLFGTTGEGPSFSPEERFAVWQAAAQAREAYPDFRLLAGTGTPSLDETVSLNKYAFDLGFDAVVTLPPFYFRDAAEDGLFTWFSQVINQSVPDDGYLLGYHFPRVSGVPLPISLLQRLQDAYPVQFAGVKDSSGDLEHARQLNSQLNDRVILVGSDSLLSENLSAGGSGCITALANLISPDLRAIWDAYQKGQCDDAAQERVSAARQALKDYAPLPAAIKALLPLLHDFPHWPVKPPLLPFSREQIKPAAEALRSIPVP
jgi:4-hydroxy-tetrahydrodipicolinate synthase